MKHHRPEDREAGRILRSTRTVAIVGASPDPARPSHRVADYLRAAGFDVIPVNPNADEVIGQKSYPTLSDVPSSVDLVVIFRRPPNGGPVVEQAIEKHARAVWFQPGAYDDAAVAYAQAAGLAVVADLCVHHEHRAWIGRTAGHA